MGDQEHDNPLPGDYPEPEPEPAPEVPAEDEPASEPEVTEQTEETEMAQPQTSQTKATPKEIADAEHYLFSLGHSREDAQKHAARIGHLKVLEHQRAGENPLHEED
jgi:hypothetical protein